MLAVARGSAIRGMWAIAAVSLVSQLLYDDIAAMGAGHLATVFASLFSTASASLASALQLDLLWTSFKQRFAWSCCLYEIIPIIERAGPSDQSDWRR